MPGGMAAVPSVTAPDGTVLNTANAALSLQPPSVLVRPGCLACAHKGGSMSEAMEHRVICPGKQQRAPTWSSCDDARVCFSRLSIGCVNALRQPPFLMFCCCAPL